MRFAHFMPIAALLFVFLAFSDAEIAKSGSEKAECGDFPKVSWWENLNHKKVVRYVEVKRGGDWSGYIQKWENERAKLSNIQRRGSSAVVKGVRLACISQTMGCIGAENLG